MGKRTDEVLRDAVRAGGLPDDENFRIVAAERGDVFVRPLPAHGVYIRESH